MSTVNSICLSICKQRWLSKSLRAHIANLINRDFLSGTNFTVDFFGYDYSGNTQNLIDRKVLLRGCHECDLLNFLHDVLTSKQDSVYIDIGANTGHHALYCARYASHIHAFEPYEPVRNSLMEKISANKLNNIQTHKYGLGNENTKQQFFIPPDENLGTGSFLSDFSKDNTPGTELEIRRADDVFDELGILSVDIVKIDVEGLEKQVLEGMQESLRKIRPVVIFEYSMFETESKYDKSDMQRLFPENYLFYRFTHTGKRRHGLYKLEDLDNIDVSNKKQITVIASPKERPLPLSAKQGIFKHH